jgi:TPR repeat protein
MKVLATFRTLSIRSILLLVGLGLAASMQLSMANTLPADAPQDVRVALSKAHAGDVENMHRIALYLIDSSTSDNDEMAGYAFGWALLAARNGHAQAAELTGVMYRSGIGVPQNYVKARKWLERALARGSREPYFELAILYADDNNPGVDKNKSADYLTEAIRMSEPRACLISARNKIVEGIQVRRLLNEINCAADGGLPDAMEMLAEYHLAKKSPYAVQNARTWLERALDAGSTTAAIKLAKLDNE